MPPRRTLTPFAWLLAATTAGPALAQSEAPETVVAPPAESVTVGGPVGGPDTDPFLPPGSVMSREDRARMAPRDDVGGLGRSQPRNSWDFDSLLTPGARGSKRSMAGRGSDLPFDGK